MPSGGDTAEVGAVHNHAGGLLKVTVGDEGSQVFLSFRFRAGIGGLADLPEGPVIGSRYCGIGLNGIVILPVPTDTAGGEIRHGQVGGCEAEAMTALLFGTVDNGIFRRFCSHGNVNLCTAGTSLNVSAGSQIADVEAVGLAG